MRMTWNAIAACMSQRNHVIGSNEMKVIIMLIVIMALIEIGVAKFGPICHAAFITKCTSGMKKT